MVLFQANIFSLSRIILLGLYLMGTTGCYKIGDQQVQRSAEGDTLRSSPSGRSASGTPNCIPHPGPLFESEPEEILLPRSFGFLEGPVWIEGDQSLLLSAWNFSDPTDGKGPPTTILQKTGDSWKEWSAQGLIRSNGLATTSDGKIFAALHGDQAIGQISRTDGSYQIIADRFNGKPFNSPNDLVIKKDGTVFFTDPNYQNDNRPGQDSITGVYRVSPQGEVYRVDDKRLQPNGIALSPDEKSLYVGSSDGIIYRYDISHDGSVGEANIFARPHAGIDGMSVDCLGQIYATLHERRELVVYRPAPDGGEAKEVARLSVRYNITNVAFGGPDYKTLYITTAGHLYSVPSKIPGSPY